MKRIVIIFLCLCEALSVQAFDRTMRLDYIFSGNKSGAEISLAGISVTDGWYGRNVNLDRVPVKGNGMLVMKESGTENILYAISFSTLFQEWQSTPEAAVLRKAFENTFLVPVPETSVTVEVDLFNSHGETVCTFIHQINPDDILIKTKSTSTVERRYIFRGGSPEECIDVVILAEGYTAGEMDRFYSDAQSAVDAILSHEPFKSHKTDFNFLAVASQSQESGVSIPHDNIWRETAVNSHFDTFYSDRYLTTTHIFRMHDILDGIPYEHLIVLANTDTYGGGGIYNSYTLTTAHHKNFKPVVVHEFGHSFGALADEYDYAEDSDPYYFPDVEPWELNITTQCDFDAKWKDMMDGGLKGVGLIEGAGYQAKGVWRATKDCRMRTNTADGFCPVCIRAITEMIEFHTAIQQ